MAKLVDHHKHAEHEQKHANRNEPVAAALLGDLLDRCGRYDAGNRCEDGHAMLPIAYKREGGGLLPTARMYR